MAVILLPSTPVNRPKLILINGGWKSSPIPPKADLYLDCRGIPNPFHIGSLSGLTGDHPPVIAWIKTQAGTQIDAMETIIAEGLAQIPSRRLADLNPLSRPYVICPMCAHGIHRSRAIKHILASRLMDAGFDVEVQ